MTRRLSLLCLLTPFLASAQLQLFTFDGSTEKAVTAIADFGTVAAGDAHEVRFHARNNTSAAIALQSISLSGQGFTLSSAPSLPFIVAPTNFTEIRVTFQAPATGTYSATFAVNSAQTMLRATVVASATVSVANSSVASLLTAGAAIDFGRVQKGASTSQQVQIANGTASSITIQSCTISGAAFQLSGLQCPATLAPTDALTATITFNPKTSGSQQGTF